MIKTVAKITPELAAQIEGTQAEGAPTNFNPVIDGNGNTIISLQTAQYLEAGLFEVIAWEAPVESDQ